MRTTWPVVGRLGADPSRICLELMRPERCADRELLQEMVAEHRKRGARVALDDLSGGPDSLACLELVRPDIAKIDTALTSGIQHSPARRALVKALVDCAHELGAKVVAEGVERVDEFRAMAELGVDLGDARPQVLTADAVHASDVVVTMGCGDACPVFPGRRYLDWDLADPAGKALDEVRPIRDDIDRRVRTLLAELTASSST